MIRPLRRAHVRMWLVLLPIALAALAVALLARTPRPIQNAVTPAEAPGAVSP